MRPHYLDPQFQPRTHGDDFRYFHFIRTFITHFNIIWFGSYNYFCGSNHRLVLVPCKYEAVPESKCPCSKSNTTGCDLSECSSTQDIYSLCEADAVLPDGTSNYDINNCHGLDIFKCSPGKLKIRVYIKQKNKEKINRSMQSKTNYV